MLHGELKPYPCCKGEAETRLFIKNTFDVYCTCCGLMTPLYDTKAEAIEAWNTRAERTCKIESSYYYDDYDLYEFEFSCGHSVNMYDKEPTKYCPNCGARVVDS